MLIGFDPHIRISAEKGAFLKNPDELLQTFKNMPEVAAASPVLQGRMIALQGSSPQVFTLNAMRPQDVNAVSGVASSVIIGNFKLSSGEFPTIVLGAGLADRLRALPSDTITLVSPRMIESALATFSKPAGEKVIVSGIFQANAREYDNTYGYTSAGLGRELLKAEENAATSIDIRLHSIENVGKVQQLLKTSLPKNVVVETWYDLHRDLYDVMQLERLASFVVLSLVIVVAVFNVLASLSMTVFEKRADIAMLKSMGASDKFIQRIYLFEGISIGILGTIAGVALGLALCFGQIHFSWLKLDTSKYILAALPLKVQPMDIIAVIIVTLLLSFLATIFPSKRAAQTQIAAALRRE
jgi:lipoprotein-releasing system permease protein